MIKLFFKHAFFLLTILLFPTLPQAQTTVTPSSLNVPPTQVPQVQGTSGQPKTDLLFIIDSSGSMASMLEGQQMIDWAKKALTNAVNQLPAEAEVGLRVYSHRIDKANKEASCRDTELLVPISGGSGSRIVQFLPFLQPKGWTPIAYTLDQAEFDFAATKERLHSIILLSDGEETCGGDPLAAARRLVEKGFKIKIFTIGFNVDATAKAQLEALAREFGGTYSDARSGLSLESELVRLTKQSFLIEKKELDNRIRGGDNFGSAVPLEVNKSYRLDHHQRQNQFDFFSVQLRPSQEITITMKPPAKCVTITGDTATESPENFACNDDESYRVVFADSNQAEILRISSYHVDRPVESDTFEIPASSSGLYYLIVGSPLVDMHRDHEFSVQIKKVFGDANTERDAGSSLNDALPITPGIHENSRVSSTDLVDVFKINVPAGSSFKVAASPTMPTQYSELEFEVMGELGEILKGFVEYDALEKGKSGTYELTQASSSTQTFYFRLKYRNTIIHEGSIVYSLAISLKSAPVPTTPPPPAPQPTSSYTPPDDSDDETVSTTPPTPSPPSSNQPSKGLGFSSWLVSVITAFMLLVVVSIFFFVKKQPVSSALGKVLGWYQISASVVSVGVGSWLLAQQQSLALQIFFLILFLALGILGLFAGGFILLNKSLRLSFWWGILQLPWIHLNLHWTVLTYSVASLLGLPVYFLLYITDKVGLHFGFDFYIGAMIKLAAELVLPGKGFEIGLGINLIAALFLMMLWLYKKNKKAVTVTLK